MYFCKLTIIKTIMIKKLFVNMMLVFMSICLFASVNDKDERALEILKERGEVVIQFELAIEININDISKIISLDGFKDGTYTAYANSKGFAAFRKLNISYEILERDILTAEELNMKSIVDLKSIDAWDFYPTYDAYLDLMETFASTYPDLCKLYEIGTLNSGRKLLALKISDNVNDDEGEAEFFYTSTMHGDETAGYVLMLHFADYLLQNYGSDDQVNEIVNNLEIWINPLANPNGTYAGGNNSVNGATRYNANYVDLNRNYPDPADGPHPDGEVWQEETLLFMEFATNHDFVISANFHGGIELINYPWDTWAQLPADGTWWDFVSHEYADIVHANSPSGYFTGENNGVTNGYAWYRVAGGRQDYMNYHQNCREVTLELSDTKLIPANQLENHWDYNYKSLLAYVEQSFYGVHGFVTDIITGDPIEAKIFITNHDADSSWVYSSLQHGDYYRYLYTGTYDFKISAPGYEPKIINNVSVNNYETVELNIELEGGDLFADFSASTTSISVNSAINFTDLSYGLPDAWEWTFEGAEIANSNIQNPQDIVYNNAGIYDVSLIVYKDGSSASITIEDFITVSVDFVMEDGIINTCEGRFMDSGGENSSYSSNEDIVLTFLPDAPDSKIKIEFVQFNVEPNATCDFDWLKIYDGSTTNSTLIGKYCGSDSPGIIEATNEEGALTFEFYSDYNVEESGWIANISCTTNVGISDNNLREVLKVYPNPVSAGYLNIESTSDFSMLQLYNILGEAVLEKRISGKQNSLNVSHLKNGVYTLKVYNEKKVIIRKIQINR